MNKFKVGDKVKVCAATDCSINIGDIYVVREVKGDNLYIKEEAFDDLRGWGYYRFELVGKEYTKEDVEKAIDVFEHFDIMRSNNGNYKLPDMEPRYYSKGSLINRLFETEKMQKLTELRTKIEELNIEAQKLEKEINA